MTDWQPIETAPRNGTSVLLFTKCHGVAEAWFHQGEWQNHHEYGAEYTGSSWVCCDDAFSIEVEETDPMHHGTATHWTSLPEPPK